MDDSRKGQEDDDVEAGRRLNRDVSEEALVEREERVWVEVPPKPKPTYVSQGTGTSDDPFPRRKKKKVRPLPPGKKIPMTPETSLDSMDVYQPPGMPPSSLSSGKSEDKPRKTASISDEVEIRRDTYSMHDIIEERKDSQDKSIRRSTVDSNQEERGTLFRSSSHGLRASTESLNLDTEGWVAGVCTITFRLP